MVQTVPWNYGILLLRSNYRCLKTPGLRLKKPKLKSKRKLAKSCLKVGGKIEEVGDTTGGGFGEGFAESNEFILWNYHVGRQKPQRLRV